MKVETPDTNKARLLAAVYMKLMAEADFEDEERFPALQAVQDVVMAQMRKIC